MTRFCYIKRNLFNVFIFVIFLIMNINNNTATVIIIIINIIIRPIIISILGTDRADTVDSGRRISI